MSKKKAKKSVIQVSAFTDFTINDSANASKPVRALKKSSAETPEETWEDIDADSTITEETNEDGSKKLTYKKKKLQHTPVDERPGNEYPEIIFYLISKYIKPEDVARFARINKACYAVTRNRSFWTLLYKRYCENHPKLPEKLKADSLKAYGLRQTVIRALYHTYDIFIKRIVRQDTKPNDLVNRSCVNVWYCKGLTYWNVYFKLKKPQYAPLETERDFLEEMDRIDANSEEDTQVLLVTCKSFHEVPPLMGMTLSSVSMLLSQGYRHHRLHLGFNSSRYPVKGVVPECSVVLDAVVGALVCDWWHPQYPHSGTVIPRQDPPLLRKNFFDT
ncbi:transmembrane protein 183 isoform X1 [Trichoplusia ni]|uniref:Transmembrane protein 183 isoform X1 n=1 Tax=Trichoplusia ni TaxID=7111 RepID=A0A7E5WGQ3_TRINI|nr:transmembrane protein 183 isoform X1 [Trichoplusia ni]